MCKGARNGPFFSASILIIASAGLRAITHVCPSRVRKVASSAQLQAINPNPENQRVFLEHRKRQQVDDRVAAHLSLQHLETSTAALFSTRVQQRFSTTDTSGSRVLAPLGLSRTVLASTLEMYELLRTISEAPVFAARYFRTRNERCFHMKVPR